MIIDRITTRARDVLTDVGKKPQLPIGKLIDSIMDTDGMGTAILQSFPKLRINRSKRVNLKSIVKEAFYQSVKLQHTYVGTEHLVLAVLALSGSKDIDIAKNALKKMAIFPSAATLDFNRKTPYLETYGTNLNLKALNDGDPVVTREEYKEVVSILLQKSRSNVLLIGDPGVGKKSIVQLLVRNLNNLNVPPLLFGYQVVEFDLLAFMMGALNKNSIDVAINALVDELRSTSRVILFIKNFQNMFFATSAGFAVPMFYSIFKAHLETGGIRVIATMNEDLYDRLQTENGHLIQDFTIVSVAEPTEEEAIDILRINSDYLAGYHNIQIKSEVIDYIYKKAKEGIKDTKFPQKGLELMDKACTRLLVKKTKISKRYKDLIDKTYSMAQLFDKSLQSGNFKQALSQRKDLALLEDLLYEREQQILLADPAAKALTLTTVEVDEAMFDMEDSSTITMDKKVGSLSKLLPVIKQRILGQDIAVEAVVRALIRAKLGLRSKKRPIGNFLFLGPTGVGKTELAKVLADEAFGDGSLIRLDMSDFSEKHNVARLIGAPPGYIGFGEGGELTSKIELKPESIVLFDEIEKAHPDVLNILLQVMEEGELSDAKGNRFDFSKAIIILTSNLGTEILHNANLGFGDEDKSDNKVEARLRNNLKKILKPELLNRFDETIIFKRLNEENLLKVLELLLTDVKEKLGAQKVSITINKAVKKELLKLSNSEEYGARALRRTVEKELLDRVAEVLLNDKTRPLKLKAEVDSSSKIHINLP